MKAKELKTNIIGEIERRYQAVEKYETNELCACAARDQLVHLRQFINSLPEEPVSEELEDAAYNYVFDNFGYPKETPFSFDQRCFKAGAKWQKEHSFSDSQINENIIYAKGYKQAEKDLTLTWEDIKKIGDLFQDVARDSRANKDLDASFKKDLDAPFKEILRRFLEQKGGKV